jgi:hypothetical protein
VVLIVKKTLSVYYFFRTKIDLNSKVILHYEIAHTLLRIDFIVSWGIAYNV